MELVFASVKKKTLFHQNRSGSIVKQDFQQILNPNISGVLFFFLLYSESLHIYIYIVPKCTNIHYNPKLSVPPC